MNNKKGISAIVIVAVLLLVCIAFYLVLYIPIPSFKALRTVINYFLTIIVFILLQVAIILGYYYAGKYAVKGFNLYKDRIQKTFMNIKDYVITKGR
jgi:hypothetical protein